MIATAITTAPRPQPTLAASLRSYREAGFINQVTIFADGDADTDDPACVVSRNDPPLGCLRNFAHALRCIVAAGDGDWLLFLQDDVTWARGSAAALPLQLSTIRLGCISLYCPRRVSRHLHERHGRPLVPGLYPSTLGWDTWGAQALLFPREAARRLVEDGQFKDYVANWKRNRNVDRIVPKCLLDLGLEVLYRIPSLVDHGGEANSSLGSKRVHEALSTDYFTGRA